MFNSRHADRARASHGVALPPAYSLDLPVPGNVSHYIRSMGDRVAALVALVVLAAFAATAHADIYAYTDANGVPHFSNVPADSRYAVIIKEPVPDGPGAPPLAGRNIAQRAAEFAPLIDAAAKRTAVHPALLRAVIAVESAFDPRAVSRAGAQGLMQLHPDTARRYGVADPFDPAQNLNGGARYLRDLLARYHNNLELVLAAYNAGEEAVDRHGRHVPPYRETRAYVPAVLKRYREYLVRAS